MGEMQLQPFEADIARAFDGGDEVALHAGDVFLGHGFRHARHAGAEGDCGRGDGGPSARIGLGDVVVALPGEVGAGFAAGMGDLDAGHAAGGLDRGDGGAEGIGLGVVPEAEAARGDAAFGGDARRLDDQQAGAAAREGGEVNLVPVIQDAVLGHVLAHRRDRDAVAERDVF